MFYMVYVEGGNSPGKKYTNIDEAKAEAARLCVKEGRRVFILAPTEYCDPPSVNWKTGL